MNVGRARPDLHAFRDLQHAGHALRRLSALRAKDNVLDNLNTAVKTYLTSIDPDEPGDADKRRLNEILLFSMNMEHAGDVLDQNLLSHMAERLRRGLNFFQGGASELSRYSIAWPPICIRRLPCS
jgi:Na+/phosphate symporter